jgi:vitamin B12 transporter
MVSGNGRNTRITVRLSAALLAMILLSSGVTLGQHTARTSSDDVYRLESITVVAYSIEEFIKSHPESVTLLARPEIEKRNFGDIGEAISSMPGVEVRRRAGLGSRVIIRGGASNGVLVLIDGKPINSSQFGAVDLDSLPLDMVERIMVFKPPVPVEFGPGASGGAVNIVTRVNKKAATATTKVRVEGGSFGTVSGSATRIQPVGEDQVFVTAGGSRTDGKRTNSDNTKGNFSAQWRRDLEGSDSIDFTGRYYGVERGAPGPLDNPTPDARQTYHHASFGLDYDGLWTGSGPFSIKGWGDFEYLDDRTQFGENTELKVYKIGVKNEFTWPMDKDYSFKFGGSAEGNFVDHTQSGYHDRGRTSLYSEYEQEWKPWTFVLGARGDYTSDFAFNPGAQGGASFALGPNTALRGNVGYAVEIPTFAQLYQPTHGSADQVRGNPDLEEERSVSVDIGLEHRWSGKSSMECSLFRTDVFNFITSVRGDDKIYRGVNLDHATRQGLELSAKSAFNDFVSLRFSYVFLDTRNHETDKELLYAPKHTLKGSGTLTLPFGLRLEPEIKYASARFGDLDNSSEKRLGGYTTVNFKATLPFDLGRCEAEAFVSVQNLLDHDFSVHFGYPDNGLRAMLGIQVEL